MSLDVYLTVPCEPKRCWCRCGHEHMDPTPDEVFSNNITHNLNAMAGEAGIYEALWRPEEIGITKASQLIDPLTNGLDLLRSDPQRFKRHNPPNKWGDYDGLVDFVCEYLKACRAHPEADVSVSR